jgi:cytochrome b
LKIVHWKDMTMSHKVLVWDAPTRTFHWLQALSFLGAYLTAESEKHRDIHILCGFILFGLIVFRVLWGFVGTRHARFSSFLFKPGEVITYLRALLRGQAAQFVGHNPLGSIAIWLLLGLGLVLSITGIMLLQDDVSDVVVTLHGYATNAMLVVIGMHLAGVLVSSVLHKEKLVPAMLHGHKSAHPDHAIESAYPAIALIMLVAVAVFAYWYLH